MRDPLSAFDRSHIESVALESGYDHERLAALLRTHQEGLRTLPGAAELVHEWRRTLPDDPLLFREGRVFYVALDERIWRQFQEPLGVDDATLRAVMAVHDRVTRAAADRAEEAVDAALADAHAMVLVPE